VHWNTKSTISSAEIRASEERDDKSASEREAKCKGRSGLDKQKLSWNPPKMENKGSSCVYCMKQKPPIQK